MSSQFSYELDERQIRIMLRDAELEYQESAWEQFSCTLIQDAGKPHAALRKFNFGISRQIVVPVFFIAVIAGLSALLFSFVDFKKKDKDAVERLLENKASFVVSEPQQNPAPVNTVQATHIESSASSAIQESKPESLPQAASAPPVLADVKSESSDSEPKDVSKTDVSKPVVKKEEALPKKKKRKKNAVEELPTINTSATFNAASNDPEPELKLD